MAIPPTHSVATEAQEHNGSGGTWRLSHPCAIFTNRVDRPVFLEV